MKKPAIANKYDSEIYCQYMTKMLLKGWKVSKIGFIFIELQQVEATCCDVVCIEKGRLEGSAYASGDDELMERTQVGKYEYLFLKEGKAKEIKESLLRGEEFVGYKTYMRTNLLVLCALACNFPNLFLVFLTKQWFPTNLLFVVVTLLIFADTVDLFMRGTKKNRILAGKSRIAWYRIMRLFVPMTALISLGVNYILYILM